MKRKLRNNRIGYKIGLLQKYTNNNLEKNTEI